MSERELERRLEQLPRDAWQLPDPPPAPFPARGGGAPRGRLVLRPAVVTVLSLALLAAGLVIGLAIRTGEEGGEGVRPVVQRVELRPFGGRGAGAHGTVAIERGSGAAGSTAVVRMGGLRPSARHDFYELWLIGRDGAVVSLASFRVPASGRRELRVALPVARGRFTFVDLSREPDDGDPAHSTHSVLRGPV